MPPNPVLHSALEPIPRPDTVPVLGVPLALTDYQRVLAWIDEMVARRERGYVCVANVHTVMAFSEDLALREAILGSSFNLPDGQPLVWAVNALGYDLGSRVYGPELMLRACARGATTGQPLNLRRRYPGVRIVGGYSPPHRTLHEDERAAIAEEINRSGADVVWVGIGVPKQEKWMAEMRGQIEAPVLVGVGAAFDFHAGRVPQAPNWMQEAGLEWAYRLVREPRRLWRRYMRYNPRFVGSFARQLVAHRRALRAR
jgi:N-acetylglucosaminyldiphosphoundecaprenol N-acetyl-beta-D-mannosaminyltransferase